MESVHTYKVINPNNCTHVQVNNFFNQFLESKETYEYNQTTITNFSSDNNSDNLSESETKNYFITKNKLLYIFQNLKGKLSSGVDTIPNIVLKNISIKMIIEYCKIINNMLNNSYFPTKWKKAKVILLPKKDKDSINPKNLTGISLLPNISKIFEICINNNINNHCKSNNLIHK